MHASKDVERWKKIAEKAGELVDTFKEAYESCTVDREALQQKLTPSTATPEILET